MSRTPERASLSTMGADDDVPMSLVVALSGIRDPEFLSQVTGRPRHEVAQWQPSRSESGGGEVGDDTSLTAHCRARIADTLMGAPELAHRVRIDFLADLPSEPRSGELAIRRITGATLSELDGLGRIAERARVPRETVDEAIALRALFLGEPTLALSRCEPYLQSAPPAWVLRTAALAQHLCGAVETSLDLYRQLAELEPEARLAGASVALLSGHREIADSLTAGIDDVPATSLGRGMRLLVRGVRSSVDDDPLRALSYLAQAAAALRPVGPGLLLPVTPTALAAWVAVDSGQATTVADLLASAICDGVGGPAAVQRHRLLEAWAAMTDGRLQTAEAVFSTIDEHTLPPRDIFPLLALRLGVARRRADTAELDRLWQSAKQHLLEMPVTLDLLPSLGEFVVAAARLHDTRTVDLLVEQAEELLEGLGRPRAWAPMFAWYQLQAAILTDDPDRLRAQATLLSALAGCDPTAAVLGHAGQTWFHVLRGTVDRAVVLHDVEQLQGVGLAWDASKLAALAAGQSTDRAVMQELMQVARRLQAMTGSSSPSALHGDHDGQLTAREWQVANLVLDGVPYREIGERLFITPKTVEHHVARIRRKLGATSRRDLIAMLRGLSGRTPGSDATHTVRPSRGA